MSSVADRDDHSGKRSTMRGRDPSDVVGASTFVQRAAAASGAEEGKREDRYESIATQQQPILRSATVPAVKKFMEDLATYHLAMKCRGMKSPPMVTMVTPDAMDAMPLFLKSIGIDHNLKPWSLIMQKEMAVLYGPELDVEGLTQEDYRKWESTISKAFEQIRAGMLDLLDDISDDEAARRVKRRARWTVSSGSFEQVFNEFQQGWYAAMRLEGLRNVYYGSPAKEKLAAKLLCSMLYPPKFQGLVETRAKRKDVLKNPDLFLEFVLECKMLYIPFEESSEASARTTSSRGRSKLVTNDTRSFTAGGRGGRGGRGGSGSFGGSGGSHRGGSSNTGSKVSAPFVGKCYGCGEIGHKRPDCPSQNQSKKSGSIVRSSAGAGHAVDEQEVVVEGVEVPKPRRPVGIVTIAGVKKPYCLDSGASGVYLAEEAGKEIATHANVASGLVTVQRFKTPVELTIAEESKVLKAYYRITAPASLVFTRSKLRVDVERVAFTVTRGLVAEVLFGNEFIEKQLKINLEDCLHTNEFVKVSKVESDESKVATLHAMLADSKDMMVEEEDEALEQTDVLDLLAGEEEYDNTNEELRGTIERMVDRKMDESLPMPMSEHDPVQVKLKLEKALQDAVSNGLSSRNAQRLKQYLFEAGESEECVEVVKESESASVVNKAAEAFVIPEPSWDPLQQHRDDVARMMEDRGEGSFRLLKPVSITPADAFRLTLSNDPPAKVPWIEEEMKPTVFDIRYYQRHYSIVDSEFLARKMLELEWADLVYLNRKARVISPALPVRKAGADPKGSVMDQLRLAIDLRAVNQHTISVFWPTPLLETFPQRASGKKFFAVLDMKDGFWVMYLHPNTQKFYSIGTDRGVWTSKRLLHGAKNATAHYQAAMDSVLAELIEKNDCIVYVDDILVMGETEDALVDNLIKVIDKLWKAGFKISAKKTVFFAKEVKFCGKLYSADGVRFDPAAIETLVKMKQPTDAAELRTYLCTANWFRLAIPRFAETIAPLQELLKLALQEARERKRKSLVGMALVDLGWNAKHVKSFEDVNLALANAVQLAYPPTDAEHKVCVFVDASKYHWAAVVTTVKETELEKPFLEQCHMPLAFLSGSFAGSMLKWPTVEKEAFSFREVCEKQAFMLKRPGGFIGFTDHRNLIFLFDNASEAADGRKQAMERLERWMVFVRGFDYELRHIPGELNACADMLSRFAAPGLALQSDEVATEIRAFAVTLRSQSQKEKAGAGALPQTEVVTTAFNQGRVAQFNVDDAPQEEELKLAQQLATKNGVAVDEPKLLNLKLIDGLWKSESGQVWIPDKHCLRVRLCIVAHQGLGGHRGSEVTLKRVAERFVWKSMRSDVHSFCRLCLQCMAVRGGGTIPRPWLGTMRATEPNELICFDYYYVQPAPVEQPQAPVYVLVLRDAFTRYTWLVPAKSADADTTAKALLDWFASFGIVHKWTSDRGSHFLNALVKKVSEVIGVDHHFTTPYAPWANGVVERANKELHEVMTMLLTEALLPTTQWPRMLSVVQSVINNSPTDVLGGRAPIEVFCGLKRQSPLDIVYYPDESSVVKVDLTKEAVKLKIEELIENVKAVRMEVSAVPVRKAVAAKKTQAVDFSVGDYVLVSSAIRQGLSKMQPVWLGPALVKERVNENTYKVLDVLELDTPTAEPRTVSAVHLKRYADRQLVLSEELKDHSAYVGFGFRVELFLAHRVTKGAWELCAKWVGYAPEECTWKLMEDWYTEVPAIVKRYVKTVEDAEEREDMFAFLKSLD